MRSNPQPGRSKEEATLSPKGPEGQFVIPTNRLPQAVAALDQGDPYLAFDLCREVLTADPTNTEALNLAGIAAFQTGLAEEALDLLRKAVFHSPHNAEIQTNLGNVLAHLGHRGDAVAAYEQAMEADPNYLESFFNFGLLMEADGQPAIAVPAFEKTLEQNPYHALAWQGLGNALKELERLEAAQSAFQAALRQDPNMATARTNLAAVLHELGNFEGAVKQCQQALKVAPDLVEARYNLGISLQDLSRHEEAIEAYKQVLSNVPKHAAAAMNIAYGLQQMGQLEAAAEAFERTISIDPSFAKAHVNLADLRLQQGDPVAALAVCDGFLDRYPGNTNLLAFKAIALSDNGHANAAEDLIDFDRFLQVQHIGPPANYINLDTFNAALSEHIRSHATLTYAPQSHATRLGSHSGELLVEPKGPFGDLEKLIWEAVDSYKANIGTDPTHPFLSARPDRMTLSVWGVVMATAGHQIPHIHPAAWLSGVYYAKIPNIVAEEIEKRAGWIAFGSLPNHFHNLSNIKTRTIQPEPGLMVLFPSYFYHHTIPFHTDETRISIAFDLTAA